MTEEHRSTSRQRVLKGGRIVINDGFSTYRCMVRNLSGTGARLKVESIVGIPDAFRLAMDDGRKYACTVVWKTAAELGVKDAAYGFVTMHRPSNVDDAEVLESLLQLFRRLARELPLIFAVHPRTAASASKFGLDSVLRSGQFPWICVPAVSYLSALSLVAGATLVITDSGGLQEETAVLGVPCLTLRDSTERPITVERGTSRLLARDLQRIDAAFHDVLEGRWPAAQEIPLWDGHAAPRVASELAQWLGVDA